jgi:hypothetical protein
MSPVVLGVVFIKRRDTFLLGFPETGTAAAWRDLDGGTCATLGTKPDEGGAVAV